MEILVLLPLYAIPCAVILALGRGLGFLLHVVGIESWVPEFMLAVALGFMIAPTVVAGHGIGFVPWILSPGMFDANSSMLSVFALPLTLPLSWWAMGQPWPPTMPSPSPEATPSARAPSLLKFPDDDRTA